MSSSQMTAQGQSTGLHMQWVTVRDESGRTHLEARWVAGGAPTTGLHRPHAA